jgi:hypothetical protein
MNCLDENIVGIKIQKQNLKLQKKAKDNASLEELECK